MEPPPLSFDWDDGNRHTCRKHGVSIEEIEAFFAATPRIAPDHKHSLTEERFIAIGRNSQGRPRFVAFTFRKKDDQRIIRPISA
ncbi:MAG: BrnT family toxin, partial [Bryobacteraceae bacterium]